MELICCIGLITHYIKQGGMGPIGPIDPCLLQTVMFVPKNIKMHALGQPTASSSELKYIRFRCFTCAIMGRPRNFNIKFIAILINNHFY